MTISHLSLIHILVLFTRATLVSSDLFGSQNIWNDISCKVINCLFKQGAERTLHLYNLLPEYSPGHHHHPQQFLFGKVQTYFSKSHPRILPLHMASQSVSSKLLLYTVATPNETKASFLFVTDHYSVLPMSYMHRSLFFTLMTLKDVTFIGLMVLSSGYMVIILQTQEVIPALL